MCELLGDITALPHFATPTAEEGEDHEGDVQVAHSL